MITIYHYLVLAAILFAIGIYGVLARRNAILVLISIELMLNAVNINFMAFSRYITPVSIAGQVFSVFAIASGAAEIGIGLAVLLLIYRGRATVNVDEVDLMKW